MARAAEPRGVGGWLLLLILWLVFFGPLRSFLINVGGLLALEVDHPALASNSDWLTYKRWAWIIWLGSAGIAFVAGYRLWKHHRKSSVTLAVSALWITGPAALLSHLTVGRIVLKQMTNASPTAIVLSITASCLFAAAWTVYLTRSRRIALTYS